MDVFGTFAVNDTFFDPIVVVPLFVVQVIVTVPDVAFGIWFAMLVGTVHEYDVVLVFSVAILPDAVPMEYVRTCENDVDALPETEIVTAEPMLTDVAESVGVVARGIVAQVNDPVPLIDPGV